MDFLKTVQGWILQLSRQIPAVAARRVDVDDDSEDELVATVLKVNVELACLIRRIDIKNEEPNKPAAPDAGKDKSDDPGWLEDSEDEDKDDPYSSILESQQWPYDPNAASGIYEPYDPYA